MLRRVWQPNCAMRTTICPPNSIVMNTRQPLSLQHLMTTRVPCFLMRSPTVTPVQQTPSHNLSRALKVIWNTHLPTVITIIYTGCPTKLPTRTTSATIHSTLIAAHFIPAFTSAVLVSLINPMDCTLCATLEAAELTR